MYAYLRPSVSARDMMADRSFVYVRSIHLSRDCYASLDVSGRSRGWGHGRISLAYVVWVGQWEGFLET